MCKLCFAKVVDFHHIEQEPMANLGMEGLDRLHNAMEGKSKGEKIECRKGKYRCISEGVEVAGSRENLRV